MATLQELTAALAKADAASDAMGAKVLADHIRSMMAGGSGKPATSADIPLAPGAANRMAAEESHRAPEQADNWLGKIVAPFEAAAAVGSGMVGGLIGSARGGPLGIPFSNAKDAKSLEDEGGALAERLTYHPRTQSGQHMAQMIGEGLANSGIIGVPIPELNTLGRSLSSSGAVVRGMARASSAAQFADDATIAGRAASQPGAMAGGDAQAVAPTKLRDLVMRQRTATEVRDRAAVKSSGIGNSDSMRAVQSILDAAEVSTPEEIANLRAALRQPGPSMIPGSAPTVPQLIQSDGVSQLQRTVQNMGDTKLRARETVNNAARIDALNRISPVTGDIVQAKENMGNMVTNFATSAEKNATERIGRMYDAIDPEGASKFFLPMDEMQAAKDKYLGPGTFGSGGSVDAALKTAREIGTEKIEAVTASRAGIGQETLVDAVKKAGGIRSNAFISADFTGELKNLKESGVGHLVKRDTGMPVERMAEKMHEAGFLPDEDPATLINFLHDHGAGKPTYAASADFDAMYRRMAAQGTMGDVLAAGEYAKPVPYDALQNLRSSIGEAAEEAKAKGRNRDHAALSSMIAEIDSSINKVGGGNGVAGEHFPLDMAGRWRDANAQHAGKMDQFHTGPQTSLFRKGGDGQMSIQGGEIPGKFFNAAGSQIADAQSFKRLVGDNPILYDALKNYAITDLAGQTLKDGMLSDQMVNGNKGGSGWLGGRSGAIRELFDPSEQSLLSQFGAEIKRAALADVRGMAKGSNTAQNAFHLGALDSPIVDMVAHKIPVVRALAGPAIAKLRDMAIKNRTNALGALLSDPELLDSAIGKYQQSKASSLARSQLAQKVDVVRHSQATKAAQASAEAQAQSNLAARMAEGRQQKAAGIAGAQSIDDAVKAFSTPADQP